ncbi:MAG: DUF6249 domain-containing protein [Caulobacterales bacterium]
MEDILVPMGFFGMIVAIVVANVWGGVQAKRELNQTLRHAMDSGQPLNPEMIIALVKPVRTWIHDLRSGIILTALGVGFGICGAFFSSGSGSGIIHGSSSGGDTDVLIDAGSHGFYVLAAVFASLGIGFIIAALIRRDRKAP